MAIIEGYENCTYNGDFIALVRPTALVCSGNGECVDGVCICFPGYTGSSDVYNLNGISCHLNAYAIQGVAVVGALQLVQASVLCFKSGVTQWKLFRNRGKSRTWKETFSHPPIQIFLCLYVSLFFGWIYYIREIALKETSLGDEPLHTISFACFVALYFLASNIMQFTAFKSLFKGLKMGKLQGEKIQSMLRKFRIGMIVGNIAYVAGKLSVVSLLARPTTNRAPWFNGLGVVVVYNNMSIFVTIVVVQYWTSKLKDILEDYNKEMTEKKGSSSAKAPSAKELQLEKTLLQLQGAVKAARVGAVITFIVYGSVSVPVLWAYQDYAIMVGAILVGVNIVKIAKVYSRLKSPGNSSVQPSSGPNSSVATAVDGEKSQVTVSTVSQAK